ncbi:hypothetical protein ACP70R_027803 [Stipagrostis hirtigluma subsp. patula]
MLRLKQHLISALRATAPLPAASPYRLPLSTTSIATHPAGFVAEDYLVASCGLTPAQARKASKYLPGLKSPEKADAVRALLAGIRLDKADVAAAVARYPRLLSCKVGKTLTPRLARLREIGLSPPQISRLVTVAPETLFSPAKISRIAFYLSFLGSYDKLHSALKSYYLLSQDLDNVVRPNIAFLQKCGLTDCDIGKQFLQNSRMLLLDPDNLKQIVVAAEELGVPRNSKMFKYALLTLYQLNPGRLNAKLNFLKKVFGCSEAELGIAVCKSPSILSKSEGKVVRTLEFLKTVVGLEPSYTIRRPSLLGLSIERRLMPRHYIMKVLKAKGLVTKHIDFYSTVCYSEKRFVEKYLVPYNKSVPGLIDAYAAACTGQVPPEP